MLKRNDTNLLIERRNKEPRCGIVLKDRKREKSVELNKVRKKEGHTLFKLP